MGVIKYLAGVLSPLIIRGNREMGDKVGIDVLSGLRELGLTEYESKVYYCLLESGPLKPSEVSIRSGVPRTKVYDAIKSLERKGLVQFFGKPRVCRPLDVDHIFEKIIREEEERLKKLKIVISSIKKLKAKSLGVINEGERKFVVVSSEYVVAKLRSLASSAKRSFYGLVDAWGLELLSECRYELGLLPLNGVDVKVVVDGNPEALESLDAPFAVKVNVVRGGYSLFTIDKTYVFLVDSNLGVGFVIELPQLAEILDSMMILESWETGLPLVKFIELAKLGFGDYPVVWRGEVEILKALREVVIEALDEDQLVAMSKKLFERVKDIVVETLRMPLEAAMPIWVSILRSALADRGSVRYEPYTKMITLEYLGENKLPPTAWFLVFLGFLVSRGVNPVRVYQESSNGSTIMQIKLVVKVEGKDEKFKS